MKIRNIWILKNGQRELYQEINQKNNKKFWFGGSGVVLCAYTTYADAQKAKKLALKDQWLTPPVIWVKRIKMDI